MNPIILKILIQITGIYERCSMDYNKDAGITQTFFKIMQNKLGWKSPARQPPNSYEKEVVSYDSVQTFKQADEFPELSGKVTKWNFFVEID